MPQTQMRMHVVGINRGVITDSGQLWCKVQTTEKFEHQDDNTMGERACDVSGTHAFFDQVKKAGVALPADLDVMCTISITKTKARLVVDSLVAPVKPAGK